MKRALLVGINYTGTDSALNGCINDISNINKFLLEGKKILITGASSGIGLALALQAIEEGALVAVCARNCSQLIQNYAHYIEEGRLLVMSVDVSKEIACKQFIEAVISKWNKILCQLVIWSGWLWSLWMPVLECLSKPGLHQKASPVHSN